MANETPDRARTQEVEVPRDEQQNFTSPNRELARVVGLGGSAGSIDALKTFFELMPAQTGMAFVVVIHLSPDHESAMAKLLGRVTTMRAVQAENDMEIAGNTIYVIPPGKNLLIQDGCLKLTNFEHEQGKRVAVDLFFRSLAEAYGANAMAIVLSGADGDGALGIKRIKECGGLTVAQDPVEAEHSGMPRSAIETGMIDWILPVAEMPPRIVTYLENATRLQVPPEIVPSADAREPAPVQDGESALREILLFLRTRTGRDFFAYKRATVIRRIARRMQVNNLAEMRAYATFLRNQPGEAGALLQDLLISVTNFFRDPEAFAALEQVIPKIFEGKAKGDSVRVWVPGCASGEEAHSIAILLLEQAAKLVTPPRLQIFASDLDESAIQIARHGIYPLTIEADVSEARLEKYFVRETRGFRLRNEVREMVLFATHDLLKDSPFSRIDLISCRNLLIYLDRPAQARVIDTFHFARSLDLIDHQQPNPLMGLRTFPRM